MVSRSKQSKEDVQTSLSSKLRYATPPMGEALPFVSSLYTESILCEICSKAFMNISVLPKQYEKNRGGLLRLPLPLLLNSLESITSKFGLLPSLFSVLIHLRKFMLDISKSDRV
jgi:hypothetical protein